MSLPIDLPAWIETNKCDFRPPVCNKCAFSDQLKVFFVGGPNTRSDYHLEEGEELFYQIEGDMVLKVIERGKPRDIRIKQGEIFLLPSRVEHSPQRFEGTVGCVVERTRNTSELDCVRYFIEGTTDRLYERWFHLEDVVKDLPPVIEAYRASEAFRTGRPTSESFIAPAPFEPSRVWLGAPIDLENFIRRHEADLMYSLRSHEERV